MIGTHLAWQGSEAAVTRLGGVFKKRIAKAMRFLSNPKDWHGITRSVYGIRLAAWHHAVHVFLRLDAIRLYEPITYATSSQFHTALRADSIHGYAVIKMRKANGKG